ncbi:MarR family transcriptional regulator [Bacillus sp. ISL-51]|uniref:MarR family winged helix-turn-helix transcriptional regulator n=1 Tax=Bacteria TaxID=2 RepID=UPI001BE6CBA2|nr:MULTISPECIES: MarR family transcriptional regulator [Bacteria]MBT2575506.1 MarR family transcriptional regulator [Bacillus sp. ISL-51]MBT2635225.1 MarR family transcriptional regulator [Bacillus sp. ISL-26]MBT2711408.1 MarR family transcriptional regulator [Pseudomonas sp. ISL-88]
MDFSNEIKDLFFMQQAYATLFSVLNKIQIRGDEYFGNLTSRQFMTIVAILHLPEDETSINNIARKLGTSKQNVNTLINSIEKKGYLLTQPSKRDRRAVNVKVTESGQRAMAVCGEKAIYFMADIFKDFSTDELETLWNLLKKLYSYDGEEQDGFEETAPDLELNHNGKDLQTNMLKEFSKLRRKKETQSEKYCRS